MLITSKCQSAFGGWSHDLGKDWEVMLMRWSLLNVPWEEHPAVIKNCLGTVDPADPTGKKLIAQPVRGTNGKWATVANINDNREAAGQKILTIPTDIDPALRVKQVSAVVSDYISSLWKCF